MNLGVKGGPCIMGPLQEARQEAGQLKAELDALKAEQDSRNYKEKGNSLFGEVSCPN